MFCGSWPLDSLDKSLVSSLELPKWGCRLYSLIKSQRALKDMSFCRVSVKNLYLEMLGVFLEHRKISPFHKCIVTFEICIPAVDVVTIQNWTFWCNRLVISCDCGFEHLLSRTHCTKWQIKTINNCDGLMSSL